MADQTPVFDGMLAKQEDTQVWFPPFISENSAQQPRAITAFGIINYGKAQNDMNEIKTTRPQDTPVSNRMSSLHTSISNFDRTLTQLIERLHGALGPELDHPTDPSSTRVTQDRPQVSPLSASLDNVIEKVREMTETVENVAERLEL